MLFNLVMSTAAIMIVQNGPLLLLTISYSLLMSRLTPDTIHKGIEDLVWTISLQSSFVWREQMQDCELEHHFYY